MNMRSSGAPRAQLVLGPAYAIRNAVIVLHTEAQHSSVLYCTALHYTVIYPLLQLEHSDQDPRNAGFCGSQLMRQPFAVLDRTSSLLD